MDNSDLTEVSGSLELQYQEVPCKRAVGGADFTRGVADFDFSIGGRYAWRPSKSYFRVELTLAAESGENARQPHTLDKLAFADDMCAGLFDNVYVRAGGTNVSSIINYSGQAHMIKSRLGKTRAWLNGVGKEGFGFNPYFSDRVHAISVDGENTEENTHASRVHPVTVATSVTLPTPIAGSTTSAIVGVGTAFLTDLSVGDTIVIANQSFPVVSIDDDLTAEVGVKVGQTGIGLTTDVYVMKPSSASLRANKIYVNWQPPVGIFDHDGLLGSGEYRIQLNPNTNYKKAIVQAATDLDEKKEYTVTVDNVRFYACIEKSNLPTSGTESLMLTEQAIQTKTITNPGGNNVLDFTIPPSTQAITIGVQSQVAGSNNIIPVTSFTTADKSDRELANLQLTYANTTKPPSNWESVYGVGVNQLQQRYLTTQLESGLMFQDGGESFREWIARGGLYHFGFERDSDDRSTNLQVSIKYDGLEPNANLVVCAHYTRRVDITTADGRIVNVTQLSV